MRLKAMCGSAARLLGLAGLVVLMLSLTVRADDQKPSKDGKPKDGSKAGKKASEPKDDRARPRFMSLAELFRRLGGNRDRRDRRYRRDRSADRRPTAQEARLGVQASPPSAALVDQLDLPRGRGILLEEVGVNTPAGKAGLKPHDILLEVDGKPVPNDRTGFSKLLEGIVADRKIDVVVMRKGKKETIKGLVLARVVGTTTD